MNPTDLRHYDTDSSQCQMRQWRTACFQQLALMRLTFQCQKSGPGCFGDNGCSITTTLNNKSNGNHVILIRAWYWQFKRNRTRPRTDVHSDCSHYDILKHGFIGNSGGMTWLIFLLTVATTTFTAWQNSIQYA